MLSVRSVEVRSSRHRLGLDVQTIPKKDPERLPLLHWKNGRKITDRITGQRTFDKWKNRDESVGFKSKTGKKFDARVVIEPGMKAGKSDRVKIRFHGFGAGESKGCEMSALRR